MGTICRPWRYQTSEELIQFPWSTLNRDPTVVGCEYPPHQTMGPRYDYQSPHSVYRIPRDQLAHFDPNFNDVVLEPTAARLDLIASSPIPNCGWIISSRFLDLLSRFTLPEHRVYPLPVVQMGKAVDGYSFIHLPQVHTQLTESMSVSDAEAHLHAIDGLLSLDVIPIYTPTRFGYFFVSQPLKRAIEEAQLTGIRFGTAKLFRVS